MTKQDETEDFAAMFAESERKAPGPKSRREPRLGDMVKGRVVSVGRDGAFVALADGKAEAMLDPGELVDEAGKVRVAVGDQIEARVVEIDGKAGCVVLRRSLGHGAAGKEELEDAFRHGIPVEGRVTAVNKGGVDVDIGGVRAFCPVSQLDRRHVDDPAAFIGQKLAFRITRYEADRRGANLVLSRRAILAEEDQARAAELRRRLAPGVVLPGVVTGLKDYGAFVDLGGIEGMLHVSELSFGRVNRVSDVLSVGQPVTVQVLKIERRDDPRRPDQISLSLKALASDPWAEATERLAEGQKVRGPVTRVESFGAFVEIAPGVEGLLHASALAPGQHTRHARDVVKVGQVLELVILSVDRERRRVALGRAEADGGVDADDLAEARRQGGQKLGTLGDLFKNRKL